MIIGAQKAGTTSLKNYLGQHPVLYTHPHKEFAFFVDPEQYERKFENAQKKYFGNHNKDQILIAKNAGLYVSEPAILKLKEHNPDCKLVFILRNPVERTYSSFLMEKNYGMIDSPFESIKNVIKNKKEAGWEYEFLIGMSIYYQHLKILYKHFPPEQVMLVRFDELVSASQDICAKIYEWLGIDAGFIPDTSRQFNKTTVTRSSSYGRFVMHLTRNHNPVKKAVRKILPGKMDYKIGEFLRKINKRNKTYEPMSDEIKEFLLSFFAPYNDELGKLTGMDFSGWNKPR